MKPHKTYVDYSKQFNFGSLHTSIIKGEWEDA